MSGDLQLNKILGAALATGLVIMLAGTAAKLVYDKEDAAPAKPGYAIEVADTGDGAAAAVADTPPDWGTVLPVADVAAGEKTFQKCTTCHFNAPGAGVMTGPNLYGVVGRPTASFAGMAYSDAMMAHAKDSPNWTYDQLYMFLAAPGKWVKGTKMTFVGIKTPEDRVNLIAYLRSQGSTGYAIPAPDPSRAAVSAPAATPGIAVAGASAPTAAPVPAARTPVAAGAVAKASATKVETPLSGTPAAASPAASPQ